MVHEKVWSGRGEGSFHLPPKSQQAPPPFPPPPARMNTSSTIAVEPSSLLPPAMGH